MSEIENTVSRVEYEYVQRFKISASPKPGKIRRKVYLYSKKLMLIV